MENLDGIVLSILSEIIEVAQLTHEKGWAEGNGGNFTIRIDEEIATWWIDSDIKEQKKIPLIKNFRELDGDFFIVKGAGKRLRDIIKSPKDNLCIGQINNKEFSIIWPLKCPFKPTSEFISHLIIQEYNKRNNPDNTVVFHTHPTELIAFSLLKWIQNTDSLNKLLSGVTPSLGIFLPNGIGYAPYEIPSSDELASITEKLIPYHQMILWEKHGILCTGKSMLECFDLIDITNKAAKIYLLTRPDAIKLLSEKNIDDIKERFH
ncbi:MAG: rhamnulose-1-phosphate aldolase [Candidatus Thorarchaeota archaeon]